jgi:hypothetical protein
MFAGRIATGSITVPRRCLAPGMETPVRRKKFEKYISWKLSVRINGYFTNLPVSLMD